MGGVGECFWFGIWNLFVFCGSVGAVLGVVRCFLGVVRWDVVLGFFFGGLRLVLTDVSKGIVVVL